MAVVIQDLFLPSRRVVGSGQLRKEREAKEETLRSGKFKFYVTARPADFPVDLGIARTLGKYHLAEGIKLQLSRGRKTTATIEWADGRSHAIELAHREAKDPIGLIAWWRGGTAFWIAGDDKLRKIDFSNAAEVKDESWTWKDAPEDFGGAPEKVRAEIRKNKPAAKKHSHTDINAPGEYHISDRVTAIVTTQKDGQASEVQSYLDRSLIEWDELLTQSVPSKREILEGIGYGKADVAIPDAAIPMLLALVKSGSPATQCRCLGTLRKLEKPSDEVLDTVIGKLDDPLSGARHRAGYLLGVFKGRSDYIVPRLMPLLEKEGTIGQEAAAFALGRIGAAAKEALPALEAIAALRQLPSN